MLMETDTASMREQGTGGLSIAVSGVNYLEELPFFAMKCCRDCNGWACARRRAY